MFNSLKIYKHRRKTFQNASSTAIYCASSLYKAVIGDYSIDIKKYMEGKKLSSNNESSPALFSASFGQEAVIGDYSTDIKKYLEGKKTFY